MSKNRKQAGRRSLVPPTEYHQVQIDSVVNYKGKKAIYFYLPGWKNKIGISISATIPIKVTDPLDIGFKSGSTGESIGPGGKQRRPEEVIALILCRGAKIPFVFIR